MYFAVLRCRNCSGVCRLQDVLELCRSADMCRTPLPFLVPYNKANHSVLSRVSPRRVFLHLCPSTSPLDPHTFPEADRAILTVHGCGEQLERSLDHVRVHYDDQSSELLISADQVDHGVSVDLAAPINSDLFITTRGSGDVEVKKMECNVCKVQTERGNCLLHSIKGHQVEVQSNGGHVTAVGTIHGNVSIKTHGDSAVDVKKLQGTSMNVSTEHGPLSVKVIYSESSSISSSSGRIQLGHIQGNSVVKNVHGDTVIDGSNGSLNVSSHSGAIDVYVGDDSSANLHSHKGGVCVRVPSSLRAGVELRGASVEISPEVVLSEVETHTDHSQTTLKGYMNGASAAGQSIQAQTDTGSVTLRTQSWFDSLKLSQE
ncbi:protein FAM185A isoform X3 [Cynoglossus semilaevis]|uniref:Family with sequence similarity 185 member A n=1 Tax=Cynoglossus semilaevis TaxID=244447 RepID=A0A3P8V4R5_CYNSE|nr:protein FAM185A isoform X3 [Cynoglossus semilaevis]